MRKVLLLLCLFLTSISLSAQEYSIIDRRAIKLHEEAEELVKARRYDEAIEKYQASFERSVDFFESYIKMSQLLLTRGDHDKALEIAERGARRVKAGNNRFAGEFGWLITNIYVQSGAFDLALQKMAATEPLLSPEFLQSTYYRSLKKKLDFIKRELQNPKNITKERLPAPLNQFTLQYFPVLTADSKKILFTKRDGLNNYEHEDIYVSYYEDEGWAEPVPIDSFLNTRYNEGTCTISADGNILIYTSCDAPDSFGSCDLYITYKVNGKWQKAANMGKTINSRFWDSQPSLSADGSMLFFSSNRRGGYGGNDIWYSRRMPDGNWSEVKNVGDVINTDKDEVSPFIYFNNEQLFFASDGHMGFGGKDLFMSKIVNGEFTKPVNLGYPINDHQDQLALFITAQQDYAYYTENTYHEGRVDSSLLYRFNFPQEIDLGEKLIITQGKVINTKTKEPLDARLSLVSLDNDSTLYQFRSDGESGAFIMIYPDKTFSGLYVEKPGFVPKIYNVEKDSLKNINNMQIELSPAVAGEQFIFENVFFDFDQTELKPESQSSLKRLYNFLTENPKLSIMITGHTDNVGNAAYNQNLSLRRAESVQAFLEEQGIAPDRLQVKGMGDQQSLKPNDSEENRAFNRRIEIVLK
ncbi:MAG TPA: OmpA family protein [Cyclobacteriaceae bacterium]|nr:OmpA family protein [Cyclobacteriaceae bacterium]